MGQEIQKLANGFSLYVGKNPSVIQQHMMKTNHVLVLDCSGSMGYDLPQMRAQLKNKLPSLVEPGDTVSMIWFSGQGQHGFVSEKVEVSDLTDLNNLNKAIDKWLNPIGLTGFVGPLKDAQKIITDDGLYNLMFLTDGCDNVSSVQDILNTCQNMSGSFSSVVFVEYGWNCNHALLEKMADEMGGSVIFAEDFEKYDPVFHSVITNGVSKRKTLPLPTMDFVGGIVFIPSENGAKSFKIQNSSVLVPESTKAVYGFLKQDSNISLTEVTPAYQGAALFVLRRNGELVKSILEGIGDKKAARKYRNCFGKQNQLDFQAELVANSKNPTPQSITASMEEESNITVLDVLDLLSSGENYLSLQNLKYNSMSRKHSVKEEADLSFKRDWTVDKLPFKSLSWSEDRPNVNVLMKIPGHVALPPNNLVKEAVFPTFVWRNYNIIRDGIVNFDILPMYLDESTYNQLEQHKVVSGGYNPNMVYEVNIRQMPILSYEDVEKVSLKDYFQQSLDILKLKAEQKVYKAYLESLGEERKSETFIEKYGEDAANWLKEIGITDFNGYSPKTQAEDSTDFYMGVRMVTKLKGLSSLPSYNAYMKKASTGKKLNTSDSLLSPYIEACEKMKTSFQLPVLLDELKKKDEISKKAMKGLIMKLAKTRFTLIVGQTWFDGNDPEDTRYELDDNGNKIQCTVSIEDIQVKI